MKSRRLSLFAALVLSGCVSQPLPPEEAEHRAAAVHLKQAGAQATPAEHRAALYLAAAAEAHDLLGSASAGEGARLIYNQAAADLVVLLRSSEDGNLWNRPATLSTPYHTILGDRGKGDGPNSSDGVVKYWSSHLKAAESEKVVPGPHGSCELPETLEELRRILRLHLAENGG